MNKRLKYNQTQLLECISKLPHVNFVEDHKKVLDLLIVLQNDGVELSAESILKFDMDTLCKLEDYINSAYAREDVGVNPIAEIEKASDVKLGLHKLTPTVSCATDKDFF